MTCLKKTVFTPFAFVAMTASAQVMADPIEHTIMLQATVPTADFYVLPSDANWISNTQELGYNALTGNLGTLKKQFDVKHSAGSITAQLTSSAMLTSSTDNIPLTVKFNSVELGTTSKEVVKSDKAKTHSTANLEIIPIKPDKGYEAGKYTGNVNLSFDAAIDKPSSI